MENIPAFCITLNPSSQERAIPAVREIKRVGFKTVDFLPGVDFRKKTLGDVKDLVSNRAYLELAKGRYVHEGLSGLGSVGCYMAHLGAWRKCVEMGRPIAIFEDDLLFVPDAREKITKAYEDAVRHKFDILRIQYMFPEYFSDDEKGSKISGVLSRVNRGQSTAAYIMTPRAAKIAVEHALPMEMHCDHYLDFLSLKYDLQCFYITDPVYIDRGLKSTLNHNTIRKYKGSCRKQEWIIWALVIIAIAGLIVWKRKSK